MVAPAQTSDPAVEELQRLLNLTSADLPLSTEGRMDEDTIRELKIFQATHTDLQGNPLAVDGKPGPATMAALRAAAAGSPPAPAVVPLYGGTLGHRIVRIALAEYRRRTVEEIHGKNLNTNTGPRVRQYQRATGLKGTGWPWCAAFVTWCYEEAGLLLKNEDGFASVAALEEWATGKDGKEVRCGKYRPDWRCKVRWRAREGTFRAPPGAIVIFDFSHTGIVVQGMDGADHTVEGNTAPGDKGSQRDGGGVYLRTRGHGPISGYVVLEAILS
jgi:hypothetical protein